VYNANQFLEFTLNCHFARECTSLARDPQVVAKACEDANLLTRALELYTRFEDIKRMVEKIHVDHSDWLIGFFERIPVGIWFDCLNAIVTLTIKEFYFYF